MHSHPAYAIRFHVCPRVHFPDRHTTPPYILGLAMALARWRQVLFSKNRPSVLLISFISWRRRLQFVARPEVSVSMYEEVQNSSMDTRVQFWPLRPVTSVVDFFSSCYACLFVLGKAIILPFGFSSMAGPCCGVAVARFHGNSGSHRFRFLSSQPGDCQPADCGRAAFRGVGRQYGVVVAARRYCRRYRTRSYQLPL